MNSPLGSRAPRARRSPRGYLRPFAVQRSALASHGVGNDLRTASQQAAKEPASGPRVIRRAAAVRVASSPTQEGAMKRVLTVVVPLSAIAVLAVAVTASGSQPTRHGHGSDHGGGKALT